MLSIVFLCFVYGLHKCSHFERRSSFVSCFYLSWSIFFCLQYVRYLFFCFLFFSFILLFSFFGKRRPRSFYSHFPPHNPFFSESGWFSVTAEIVCVYLLFQLLVLLLLFISKWGTIILKKKITSVRDITVSSQQRLNSFTHKNDFDWPWSNENLQMPFFVVQEEKTSISQLSASFLCANSNRPLPIFLL